MRSDEAATVFEGEQLRMTPKLDEEARLMLAEQSLNTFEDTNNGREETSQTQSESEA